MDIINRFVYRKKCNFHFILAIICLGFMSLSIRSEAQNTITISEVNYHADSTLNSGDWVEFYNYGSSSVDLSGWFMTKREINYFFIIPDNTILQPGAYLVICESDSMFTSIYPNVTNHIGSFGWIFSKKNDVINLYDINNNLVTSMEFFDEFPWPKSVDGHGRTLELKDYNLDLNSPDNWFAGCMRGSPGNGYSNCENEIIFSEINYNSSDFFDSGDWIELRNIGNQNVSLSGWRFVDKKDSISFIFPDNTFLLPQSNLVVARKINRFKSKYPNVNNVIGPFDFGLASDGEVVKLYDNFGKVYNSIAFNSLAPWPDQANGQGYTLELKDSTGKSDDGNNWFAGCLGGSPGTYFRTPCTLGVEENLLKESISLFPNPANNSLNVHVSFQNNYNNFAFSIYDALGREIKDQKYIIINSSNSEQVIQINIENFMEGIYFLRIQQDKQLAVSSSFIIKH